MLQKSIKKVTKRDGRVQEFDETRITNAILKAMRFATDGLGEDINLARELTAQVTETANNLCFTLGTDSLPVDRIHDLVEKALMRSSRPEAAQEYIRYRNKRDLARKADTMAIFDSIVKVQANDITRENANMNANTPAGMMMKFASEATKTYVDATFLSDDVKAAVGGTYLHIHDKDYYPTTSVTCVQYPLDRFLKNGFSDKNHGEVRPPKRIMVAAQLAAIIFQDCQNEMHGGQSIPAFDFFLAPYVRKSYEENVRIIIAEQVICPLPDGVEKLALAKRIDDYIAKEWKPESNFVPEGGREAAYAEMVSQLAVNRTVKDVHQAMEAFIHNMNTMHSRGGNQVVFSSINYGTDTSAEGRCIIREILNTTYEGVGNGSTAIFPIQIWKKKRGVSYLPGDRNYDLYRFACKVSARRFFPNFLNLDATYNQDDAWNPEDPRRFEHEVATMGCRTRVYGNKFGPKTSIGRGNLSFTTINIVKLGIEAMQEEEDKALRIKKFFSKLDWALEIAARQLNERFDFQKTALKKQFPLLMNGLWLGSEKLDENDSIESVINQGTLSIGFIGLAECLIALCGKHHGESEEAQELGLRIISHMAEKINGFAETYQHNFTFLATPAEGLSGKFTKRDKKTFGILPGITDKDYYTNSSHIPVYYKCTPEHKAKIEGPYHKYENAGHIFYVEIDGDATHNPEAIMQIVDLMDKYDIGYGSVNHNRNRCLDCGYESAEKGLKVCPKCGGTHIDTLQRITGYLVGTTDRWNSAKKAELRDRVVHE